MSGGHFAEGHGFKTVVVLKRAGRYGWSRSFALTKCVIARWGGGDAISDRNLRWYLDRFLGEGRITATQKFEFYEAIKRLDGNRGSARDVQSIRALGTVLGMKLRIKARESRPPPVKPGLSYWQAYRLARFLRNTAAGVNVRVYRTGQHARLPRGIEDSMSRQGVYAIKVTPSGTNA